jgi:rubrerythrin
MKTVDENTIVKTDDPATKARKTANRAIQRYTQSEAAGVQYLRDATGGYTISEDKQAHRNLVLSLVPSELADAFNNEEKARAEAEARRAAEWEVKRAEQERKDAEHDQYRREHADRWLWGGEITRGIKAYYNGYPENERETIWVCPVCRTREERDAEVAEWIRQHKGDETFDLDLPRFGGESRTPFKSYDVNPSCSVQFLCSCPPRSPFLRPGPHVWLA